MADFRKSLGDTTTRIDTTSGQLILMLEESAKIDLWGGGPSGEDLLVDVDNPMIASVSAQPIQRNGPLSTYRIVGLKSGDAVLQARLFNQSPANDTARRQLWPTMPVWASIKVSVLGAEYRQADAAWGQLKYGSTNPAWKDVKWTTMAEAGCGPTSLSIIMDYLIRLNTPGNNTPACFAGVDPRETMGYTSQYGRAANNKGEPEGTSGAVMVDNIGKHWPDYEGRRVAGADEAAILLRQGHPLVFLCNKCTTYKYDGKGNKVSITWPGHFMVVLGVENGDRTFWISDPSLAHHKYISREQLSRTTIWYIYRKAK